MNWLWPPDEITDVAVRILGIDPGLARVGYGVIDTAGGQQTMLDCGIIRTDSGRSEGERMVEIARDCGS